MGWMRKNDPRPDIEDKGLHINLYKNLVKKRPKLWDAVQKNLGELQDYYQKDPDKLLLLYEKTISDDFLNRCESPGKFWIFLVLKFSISYLNETKNVFNSHYDSVKKFYDNEIPALMRTDIEIGQLLDNEPSRNLFLNRLYSTRRDLYLQLDRLLKTYDSFKEVSKRDEELEGKLNRKLAIFRFIHPLRFNRFIKEIENNQPSLEKYIPLVYS
jgi:hypothetical protein